MKTITTTYKDYGKVKIELAPRIPRKKVIIYQDYTLVRINTRPNSIDRQMGISHETVKEKIDGFIRFKKKYREEHGIKAITPEFSLNYPLFKLRVRLSETESFATEKIDGVWFVNCPQDTDFNHPIIQERLFAFLWEVVDLAANEYVGSRGKEIADIIGTDIPDISSSHKLGCVLGRNRAVYMPLSEKGAFDEDTGKYYSNKKIQINSELMMYPHEYVDSVIIHEFIHNFFFDHGENFESTCDYYCTKILGKSEKAIVDEYGKWFLAPFAEKPLYRLIEKTQAPSYIRVNGKLLRRVSEYQKPTKIYYEYEMNK